MKTMNNRRIFVRLSEPKIFIIRYTVSSFFLFTVAFILLRFPSYSVDGVKKGIELCLNSLVPGLYPFMILTNIYAASKAAEYRFLSAEKICRFFFRLPGCCAAVIFFSLIGGLPIGAAMSSQLYKRGLISREQCGRLICFCVNPGPAFVISVVGLSVLNSEKTGVIIYASLVISSLVIGAASRFFDTEGETYISTAVSDSIPEKRPLLESAVIKSSKSVFAVCSWVVAFSCLTEMLINMNFLQGTKNFLLCITEITAGSFTASERYPVPVVAAVIGFSGICGHLQIMKEINTAGLKYKYFLVSRVINSGLSAVICGLLLKIFPVAEETFSVGVKPDSGELSGSVILSVLMIIMAILFVLGDDYRVLRKNTKKN